MYRLVETIRIEDGKPMHLYWHQKRLEISFRKLFRSKTEFNLRKLIKVPDEFLTGTVKLRFLYDDTHYKTEFSAYLPIQIKSLKLIESDSIAYPLKFIDRSNIESLSNKKEDCDDILIVKNNFLSDTSFANIVFFDGNKWFTPNDPLLKGTCRERLLHHGKIIEMPIKPADLLQFQSFRIINAMLDFDRQTAIDISNIRY